MRRCRKGEACASRGAESPNVIVGEGGGGKAYLSAPAPNMSKKHYSAAREGDHQYSARSKKREDQRREGDYV